MMAVRMDWIDIVQDMVQHGANIQVVDRDCHNLLHMAAAFNLTMMVRALIELGVDIGGNNKHGATPMFIACRHGHTDTARELMRYGAAVDSHTLEGVTPIEIARKNHHLNLATELSRSSCMFKWGDALLHRAAKKGQVREIRSLVIHTGANVAEVTSNGYTPIHIAAVYGKTKAVRELVSLGAFADSLLPDDTTPLHLAAENKHVETAIELVRLGANINGTINNGMTPLHIATQVGCEEMVEELVKLGAVVDIPNNAGVTPLTVAIMSSHWDVAEVCTQLALCLFDIYYALQLLLKLGANIDFSSENRTPLSILECQGTSEQVEWLLQHRATMHSRYDDYSTLLHHAGIIRR